MTQSAKTVPGEPTELSVRCLLDGKWYRLQSSFATDGGVRYRAHDGPILIMCGETAGTLSNGITEAKVAVQELLDWQSTGGAR